MNGLESIKMAFSSLRAHKLRSMLTMLGIIIGVGAVIAVVAIGQAGETMLKNQFTNESNTLDLMYIPSEEEMQTDYSDDFTPEDVAAIEGIPEVKQVIQSSIDYGEIRFQEQREEKLSAGINQEYVDVIGLEVIEGRNLMMADFIGAFRVAIITESLEEDLVDEGETMLGEVIYVNEQPLEVIGIVKNKGGFFAFFSEDIYMPMKSWQMVFNSTEISQISIQANSNDDMQIAGEKAADLLNRLNDRKGEYEVGDMEELGDMLGSVTRIMTIIISSIAAVSLLVGGIGVMNIMLVSVTERTREIGVRMALGATRGQILFQFLIEAVTLTLIGGLIGMGLGIGSSFIVSYFADWPALVSIPVIIGGILFSMIIGVIFGLLPANKASRLDPIEALRYE